MTKEERTDIKVGITVLVGIALLLFGIAWAKQWHIGGGQETYHAVFATVGGLEPGDPVTVNGVKRGTVQSVKLRNGDVLVTIGIDGHIDLREDATASVSMLELMGGKKLELWSGRSPQPLPASAIIPGTNAGDISSLVAMVTSLSGTLESITGKTDTLFTSLNGFLQGDTLKTKLSHTLDVANGAMTRVDAAASKASTFLSQTGPPLAETLGAADSALRSLSAVVSENRAGLRVFVDSGTRALAEARRSLQRLDSLLGASGRQNTLLYKLTRDEAFSMKLDSAIESLTKLFDQIRFQGVDANLRFFNSSKPVK